jgi:hypothetical protein
MAVRILMNWTILFVHKLHAIPRAEEINFDIPVHNLHTENSFQ